MGITAIVENDTIKLPAHVSDSGAGNAQSLGGL
jgi:hypothetical protein